MMAIPATRLLLIALAAASITAGALGCGDDDESASDTGVATTGTSDTATSGTGTTDQASTTATDADADTDGAAENDADELFLSYRVAGAGFNPKGLGLEIDARGRGRYALGEGRVVEFELSAAELDRLDSVFDRIGFAELPERIEPEADEAIADAGELEVSHDGHVVREIPGSPDSPLTPVHAAVARLIAEHVVKSGEFAPPRPNPPSPEK